MLCEPFVGSALLDASDLAAHLRKLATSRAQLYAVRLQVVWDKELTGQPWPSAVLRQPLWALTGNRSAGLYALGQSDLVLLCNNLPVDRVDEAISRIARLFDREQSCGGGSDLRVQWYDLVRNDDFEALLSAVAGSLGRPIVPNMLRSITIADLPTIVERMKSISLAKMIRRQNVLMMHSATRLLPLFRELSVSIGQSQRLFASGVDAVARPALRDYLKERLDQAILGYLTTPEGAHFARGPFSVDVSVATIMQPVFSRFEEAFSHRNDVLLEIQLDDALDDIETYFAIRDRLRTNGFRVVLDGVKSPSVLYLDLTGLDADLLKVYSPAKGGCDSTTKSAKALEGSLNRIGRDKVVIAQIETEECLKWAINVGITRVQGPFVDKLVSALANKGLLTDA